MSGEYQDCFSSTTQQEYFLGCDYVDDPPGSSGQNQTPGALAMGKVVQSMSLGDNAKRKLLNTIEEMLEMCGYNHMLNTVKKKFTDVVIDPNLPGDAGYNTANGKLTFQDENNISMSYFPHEFIHLYQDYIYSGGTNQYTKNTGLPNIEFEARFLVDFFKQLYNPNGGNIFSGAPGNSPLYADYMNWLRTYANCGRLLIVSF